MNRILPTALLVLSAGVAAAQERPPHIVIQAKPTPPAAVKPAEAPKAAVDANVTFNSEASKMFATKVQPVLSNVCASCHAAKAYDGTFRLRLIDDGYADAAAVEHNLRAAAGQLNRADPNTSPLLELAVRAHGTAKAPPLRRDQPAFKPLEFWAHWASLPEGSAAPAVIPGPATPAPVMKVVSSEPRFGTAKAEEKVEKVEEPKPAPGNVTHLKIGPTAPPPEKLPPLATTPTTPTKPGGFASSVPVDPATPTKRNPDDPFDPAAFNQYAHPTKK